MCSISPDKIVLEGAKKYIKWTNNIKIIIVTLSVSVPGNPVLVLEGWILDVGLCVQANSLCRSEGRGNLPKRSCSGQCVIVIKVNVKDGD